MIYTHNLLQFKRLEMCLPVIFVVRGGGDEAVNRRKRETINECTACKC